MTETKQLETISNAVLVEVTARAICSSASLSSRGVYSTSLDQYLEALCGECDRRTPDGSLYGFAYSRAAHSPIGLLGAAPIAQSA